ncbi:FAD-binding domain containing protein [Rhypophila decipiens]
MAPLKPSFLALLLSSLAVMVKADTCSEVASTTSIEVSTPLQVSYIAEQQEYWSTSCAALKPSCIIFPKNASEVAKVISILNTNSERFAVKSGGHSPNNEFASVAGGPLISTQRMDGVILDQATGIVRAGPGNRLDGIAAKLQGTGWTFVGGRIGNTGIGGLILGGGLSYMSAQYGWSASSVVGYELVLPNATVTTVTATSDAELFKSLKGGGNNFGVVTTYILQARRQGLVWGGNVAYARSPTTDARLLKAVRDFTEYNTDPKAAVIVTAERTNVNLIDSWILFLFYDGATPPSGMFTNFTTAVGIPIVNTCRTRTYADLMAFSNWVIVPASIITIGTETIPLPSSSNQDILTSIHAHWRNISSTVLTVPGIIASIAFQPFPKTIAAEAQSRSQDLIDVPPDADRMILEINYSFLLPSDYNRMADTMEVTYTGVRERVLAAQAAGRLPDVYLPIFMNYGFFRQDYFGRLKDESRALARRVAERVDPEGLFRGRTGGWKP